MLDELLEPEAAICINDVRTAWSMLLLTWEEDKAVVTCCNISLLNAGLESTIISECSNTLCPAGVINA